MPTAGGIVVEFVGLPGAGKSTLSHAVAQELRRRGERVSESTRDLTHGVGARRRVLAKLGFATRALIRHPVCVARIIRSVERTAQPTGMDAIRVAFNLVFVCGLVDSLAGRGGIHLLDQGVYQALWSVSASASAGTDKTGELASIAASCAGRLAADRVVVLNPPPALLVDRLATRTGSGSRLEARIGTAEFDAALEAALSALASVQALIGDADVEVLSADASVDQGSEAFRRAACELATALAAD